MGSSPNYSGLQEGTVFLLILASLRGNFSPRLRRQYEKLNPLKNSSPLHTYKKQKIVDNMS